MGLTVKRNWPLRLSKRRMIGREEAMLAGDVRVDHKG